MFMLGLLSLLGGMVLGQRSRIFALIPIVLFAVTVSSIFELFAGQSFSATVSIATIVAVCLQAGYMTGALLRYLLLTIRLARTRNMVAARALGAHRPS